MANKKEGQIAIEYLMVMGFVLLVIGALIVVYIQHQTEQNIQVNTEQAYSIARTIVDAAEEVYYLGEPSKRTIKVNMPDGITSIDIADNVLIFYARSYGGELTTIEKPSEAPLTGSLSSGPGLREIQVTATSEGVCIADKEGIC